MFNMGFFEILLLSLLALIFIGPKDLPKLARNIASFLNELKRITSDFSKSFSLSKERSIKAISDEKKNIQNLLLKSKKERNTQVKKKRKKERGNLKNKDKPTL